MPISLKPEAIKNNGGAIVGGAGGLGVGGLLVYLALEVLSGNNTKSDQAVRDARQDMKIEYITLNVNEIKGDLKSVKEDQKRILRAISRLEKP